MSTKTDPKSVFETYARLVSAGDLEGVLDLFDESVEVPDALKQLFGADTGKETLRNYIGQTVVQQNGTIEVVRTGVSDDGWAYGDLVLRSDLVRQLGQERIMGIDQLHVRDGKVVNFKFMPNILDPQTMAFYANMGVFGGKSEAVTGG